MHYSIFHLTVLLSLIVVVFSSCDNKTTEPQEIIRPVKYMRVTKGSYNQSRTFSGVAKSGILSNLSFKINGTINRIPVKVGDKIPRKGLIASIDPTDYQLQLRKTQANLDRALAEKKNAAAVFERTKLLYQDGHVSTREFDAAQADYDSKKANVASLKNQLELEKQQLKYTEIRAPNTCAIASINIEENENVRSGQQVIMTTCGTQAEVDVGVPESVITRIERGGMAKVSFDALPDQILEAVVTEVGVAVTQKASTFPVIVQLLEPNEMVKSGMSAEVTFMLGTDGSRDRILLDLVAVKEDLDGQYVCVIEKLNDGVGVVQKRYVKPGKFIHDTIEIKEGLKDGEIIVTAGASRLHDGQKVRLMNVMMEK